MSVVSRSSSPEAPAAQASAAARSPASRLAVRISMLTYVLLMGSGCYYTHLADGQLRLLRASEPVHEVLEDPATSPEVREGLELVQRAREFAAEIGLSVDGNYTSFTAWEGDRVITTVVASEPGEVEPAGFWFPLMGTLPYKGFFDPERAEAEAERQRERGRDVCVVPVRAYSTLGWFNDPVTGPMIALGEGRLAETILHELVHVTVYLPDHVDFDEGVASFIGEEASVRFFALEADAKAEARRAQVERSRELDRLMLGLREDVAALYSAQPAGPERRAERARLEAATRGELVQAGLPEVALNDACLALAATYASDTPRYANALADLDGDLRAFVAKLRAVSDADDPREALLAP